MDKPDRETARVIDELKEITDFTTSKGFEIIQKRLFERIELLSDVGDIDDSLPPEQLILEFKARKKAVAIIHDWWKEDVIGNKNQLAEVEKVIITKPWLLKEE